MKLFNLMFVLIFAFIIFYIEYKVYIIYQKYKYKNGKMSIEEKKEYETRLKKFKIVKTVIVSGSSDSRKKVGSSIVRGAVGGAVLGPVGMVGGALSGKNKITNKTTFLILYADGHKVTKTVDNDTAEFRKLCNYLEI